MDSESVERLMDIILQMKINFVHVTETLHQQTLEIRQQLAIIFDREKNGREDCLSGSDRHLEECSTRLENYKRMYASLAMMREKLVQLGGQPSPMPPALPSDKIDAVVAWRLQELNSGQNMINRFKRPVCFQVKATNHDCS